jgi:hypothetical protein
MFQITSETIIGAVIGACVVLFFIGVRNLLQKKPLPPTYDNEADVVKICKQQIEKYIDKSLARTDITNEEFLEKIGRIRDRWIDVIKEIRSDLIKTEHRK